MINVIVVDDHPLFRMGIKASFRKGKSDIVIIGEADTGAGFFRLLENGVPDLVLLDINLPDISGIEIARRLKQEYPTVKILAVSAEDTAETVKALVDLGIDGFISKRKGGTEELVEAIHSIMNGLEYYGKDISAIIYDVFVSKKKTAAPTHEFTDREKDIIKACKDGLLCKEIAIQLGISINTINTHKRNIFKKLDINNTVEMVQYALKNGFIKVE